MTLRRVARVGQQRSDVAPVDPSLGWDRRACQRCERWQQIDRHGGQAPDHSDCCLITGLLLTLGCRSVPGQDVRYQPTPMPVVRAMLQLAEVGPEDVVSDLGSGDGRIPIMDAQEFGARGVRIEIDPALVARAEANAREAGVDHKVEFRLGDMYAADLQPATVVTLFLHPQPNLNRAALEGMDARQTSFCQAFVSSV